MIRLENSIIQEPSGPGQLTGNSSQQRLTSRDKLSKLRSQECYICILRRGIVPHNRVAPGLWGLRNGDEEVVVNGFSIESLTRSLLHRREVCLVRYFRLVCR